MNWHTHCVNYRQLYLVNQLLWNKGLQGSSVITSPLWTGSYENTVKPPLNSPPPGTCEWLLNGGWPLNMGLSYISIIISRNITLLRNKWAMGEALLVHKHSSTPISNSIFFHQILQLKPNQKYQALDSHFTEMTTVWELSLGWPKGGRARLTLGRTRKVSHTPTLVRGAT